MSLKSFSFVSILLASGVALATGATGAALKPADANAVSFDKVTVADAGKVQTVKGKIVGTHCEKDICFLNFHTDFRKYVSVVVKGENFEKFANVQGADIKAKMDWYSKQPGVQVTGTVTKYEGKSGARPQIMVTSADMIRPTTAN